MEKPVEHPRSIRSFVRRQGRLTSSQQKALEQYWPVYGVEYTDSPLDLIELFGRDAPRTLEIGFGNGDSLWQQAQSNPNRDFFGIEVHRPGIGHLLIAIQDHNLGNIRISDHDAVEVMGQQLPPNSFDTVQLFFPDPWPKKRHHKRRIVQPDFVELVHRLLQPGGLFHIATDWQPYTEHVNEVMAANRNFEGQGVNNVVPRPESRPTTKFEKRGRKLGHGVWDMCFVRLT